MVHVLVCTCVVLLHPAIKSGEHHPAVKPSLAAPHQHNLGCPVQVDLRSSEELVMDGSSPAFTGASFCSYKRDPAVSRVVPDATTYQNGDSDVLHVQIPIMEK
jgi:hypothetical protein